jgi:N-acetylneuraminic acid mutarotase
MIAFNAISAYGNDLYLDNVKVIEGLAHDVSIYSIDAPGASILGGTTVTPKATVKNNGTNAETFTVSLTTTGYSSTKNVTSLAAGATIQVTFDNWTPTLGNYSLVYTTHLTGDQDASNDTRTLACGVYTATWANGAAYPQTNYLGAAVGYSHYLYTIGGNTASTLGTECYKYDVTANTWSSIAPLPAGRRVLAAALQGNFIYAIGGTDMSSVYQSTVYKYDITANSWTTVASLPVATGWGKAVAYGTNYIYFAGGLDASSNYLATVYVYDVTLNTWTAATSLPIGIFGGAFSCTGNTLVYVAGAVSTGIVNTVYVGTITSPTSITWATKAPYPGLNTIVPRTMDVALDAQVMPKGKGRTLPEGMGRTGYPAGIMYRFDGNPWGTNGIIVAGGSPTSTWTAANPSPCYVYYPATDTWFKEPDVNTPTTGAQAGTITDGAGTWKLILAGGIDATGTEITITQIMTDLLVPPTKALTLTAILPQGLYAGGGTLNPTYDDLGLHWPAGIADHVTIELHNATTYATIEYSADVALTTAGTISTTVPAIHNGSYYVTIKQHSSLETTTVLPVSFGGSTISVSFATPSDVFGGNLIQMTDLGYAMYSGDVNADGLIDSGDATLVDNLNAVVATGYLPEDVNGDGLVDSTDAGIIDNNNAMAIGVMTP